MGGAKNPEIDKSVFFPQNIHEGVIELGKKHKQRSSQEKLQIVIEGIENDNVAETCRKHGIYESQYYQWKKKLMAASDDIFSNGNKKDPEKEKLKADKERLEKTIIELSCELQTIKKKDV